MKIDLKGVNVIRRRQADGTIKTHYYLGRYKGAPKLRGEPGSPEFIESYRAATEKKKGDETKTQFLIDEYLDSGRFNKKLAERTQNDYRRMAKRFMAKFGATPIIFWRDPTSRGRLRKWHDKLAESSPRQADYMWSFMSAVFQLAVRDGKLAVNPCHGGEKLYEGTRVDVIWTTPQVGAFLSERQYAHMHLPLLIGLWTGQREGDILRLKWLAYDGETIRLKQRKPTRKGRKKNLSAIVTIPVAAPLKEALDLELARVRASGVSPVDLFDQTICLTSEGSPWVEGKSGFNGFISSFRKALAAAKITGVKFSDLRGTAVTRLTLAGCTLPEVCSITGHTHAEANAILAAHYLHKDPQIAWNAIAKLERYMNLEAKPAALGDSQEKLQTDLQTAHSVLP